MQQTWRSSQGAGASSSSSWAWKEGWQHGTEDKWHPSGWGWEGWEGWQQAHGNPESWDAWHSAGWDWQESRGRASRDRRNARRAADPGVAERRAWMEAGWRERDIVEPQMTIGSGRWREMAERNAKLDRAVQHLRLGQMQLQRALQELELREAVAAAVAAEARTARPPAAAPLPGTAPRVQGLELIAFAARDGSEQSSVASASESAAAQANAALAVAHRNSALGGTGAEPEPEAP